MVVLTFLKNDWEKINRKLQKLQNHFLPKFKPVFEHQAIQPSKPLTLYILFDLKCNVCNVQYIIHNM